MKRFVIFFVLIQLIYCNPYWIGLEEFDKEADKEQDGYCYERIHKIGPMSINETKRIDHFCLTATCLQNGNVKYNGCPLVWIKPLCIVTAGDLSLPYPECCIKVTCNETLQS